LGEHREERQLKQYSTQGTLATYEEDEVYRRCFNETAVSSLVARVHSVRMSLTDSSCSSYRKIIKGENNNTSHTSASTPTYSPNISLTTSPQNFSAAMQMLEPLDNDEQTHFLMNNSYNNGALDDDDDDNNSMDCETAYNTLDINKTKYQSFGIYIGNELCSLRNDVADILHERLLTELLKFKQELRKTSCVEM